MKSFITKDKLINIIIKIIIISFWILVWQIAYLIISEEILLVSPFSVLKTLLNLIQAKDFWQSILFSFSKIMFGFFLAVILGIILASMSYKFELIKQLLNPLITVIKSIPVASFVILALVWIDPKNLSVFVSFLMVIPIIYTNILEGLNNVDIKILQMAFVFKVSTVKKILYIYIPQTIPFFVSACSLSLGLCWKSGIAAEVIGLPKGSIGENLYEAKIFLNMNELFAWTFIIVIISFIFERFFIFIIRKLNYNK